jgi:hypothetical protein
LSDYNDSAADESILGALTGITIRDGKPYRYSDQRTVEIPPAALAPIDHEKDGS